MARFSPLFRALMRHSIESSIYATFWLVIAFAISWLEDLARITHRQEWLCFGASMLSVGLFIADGIGWFLLIFLGFKYHLKKFTK